MKPNFSNGEATQSPVPPKRTPANVSEVASSLRELRSQTPEESLGLSNETGLFRPILAATAISGLFLALLTAIPYALAKFGKDSPNPEIAKPETPETPSTTPPAATTEPPPASTTTIPAKPASVPKSKDLLDILGENGTKKANPSVNPLDKKDDDILKEIK